MQRTFIRETPNKANEKVLLSGWVSVRRDMGKIIFIHLRDSTGQVQVVFSPENETLFHVAQALSTEDVVHIEGRVMNRPQKQVNAQLATGTVEVQAEHLILLNKAQTLPFSLLSDGYDIGEEIRMKYRYLDLRRERMHNNLLQRDALLFLIRKILHGEGFIEVETPLLTKSTPEGARDYVVPARLHPGNFYALPQSPQQYKQLLMVGSVERYFQIARCFRDEDTRGDRQPEFTQLDIEKSFTTQEEILSLVENLLTRLVRELFPEKEISQTPFPRITYKDAMEKYRSDRPDFRKDPKNPNELAFGFVVDFPAFEWKESEKRWDAVHHPFTQPQVKDTVDLVEKFQQDPASILAYQYDVVLNGWELGGGSLRIHDPELLAKVFELMGNEPEDVKEKFGHLLEAFTYGVPPHGGIALGMDRMLALLLNEPNIREIIPFPKTGDGRDLMMNSPATITEAQKKELHIKTI